MAAWGPGQTYAVELGKTWDTSNNSSEAYHTIRYDFRPNSVDTTSPGNLTVEPANEQRNSKVTLNLCTTKDYGEDQIKFEGNASAAKQECILIFDKSRKTFVLERLTKSVKLKVDPKTLPKKVKRGSSGITDDDNASAKRRKGAGAVSAAPAPAPASEPAASQEPAQTGTPTPTALAAEEGGDVFRPASAASSASNPRETPVEDDFDLSESEDGSGEESSGDED